MANFTLKMLHEHFDLLGLTCFLSVSRPREERAGERHLTVEGMPGYRPEEHLIQMI